MNVKQAISKLNDLEKIIDNGLNTWVLRQILEALDTPQCDKPKECEHNYIYGTCSNCGKDKPKEECNHIYQLDALGHPRCSKCGKYAYNNKPELAKENVPEESLADKLRKAGMWSSTINEATKIAEQHFAPIIEQTRKDAHDDGFVNGLHSRDAIALNDTFEAGKRQAIAELKERFNKVFDDKFAWKKTIFNELFGTEKQ